MNEIAALDAGIEHATDPDYPSIAALGAPDRKVSARAVFGIDSDLEVPAFSIRTKHASRSRPTASTATPRSPSSPASPSTDA